MGWNRSIGSTAGCPKPSHLYSLLNRAKTWSWVLDVKDEIQRLPVA